MSVMHITHSSEVVGIDKLLGKRKTRALLGLAGIGIPLIAFWVWEIVRTGNYDRSNPPKRPLDWTDDNFVSIFFLFMGNWVFSSLWQYIILYFLGCFSNSPRKAANYAVSSSSRFDGQCTNDDRVSFVVSWEPGKPFASGSTPSLYRIRRKLQLYSLSTLPVSSSSFIWHCFTLAKRSTSAMKRVS